MSATTDSYIASINNVLSTYSDKYVQRNLLGTQKEKHWNTIKFIYASAIVEILTAYFSTTITGDDNMMTTDEAMTLMRKYNDITKTYYFLQL